MDINVNGIRLHYEIKGHGDPLLLIHGNQEDHHIFDALSEKLKDHFELHLIDTRNHGNSELTPDFSLETMAKDLIEYMKVKNLDSVYFYGFSDGGILGLLIALYDPDRIRKLFISGTNINPSGIKKSFQKRIVRAYEKRKSPYVKMMIDQPNIPKTDLKRIQIPIRMTLGENDVILRKHAHMMQKALPFATLKIFPNKDHGNYIVGETDLLDDFLTFFK